MLTIILLSVLLLICLGLTTAAILIAKAQYTRAQTYELLIEEANKTLEEFGEDANTAYRHMKNLDDKQMFEKDDEVGTVFQDLFDIVEKFNKTIQSRLE